MIPMLQINIDDIDGCSEDEFNKVVDSLAILGEVAIMENGECKAVLMELKKYENYKSILDIIDSMNEAEENQK